MRKLLRSSYFSVPLVFVVVVVAWQLGIKVSNVPEYVLPQPWHVLESFVHQIQTSYFWSNVLVTLKEAFLGFVIGSLFAVVLGILIAEVASLEAAFMPYLVSFQSVPIIAFAPLFLVWFGFGIWSKVMIAATVIFFPLMVNVEQGLKSTDPAMVEMMRAFGANEWQVFWRARLKSALPQIFTGLDVAVVLSVGGAVVGEFVGAKGGLGFQTLQANFTFDIPQLFAVLIGLGAMGVSGHLIVRLLQRRIVFWR